MKTATYIARWKQLHKSQEALALTLWLGKIWYFAIGKITSQELLTDPGLLQNLSICFQDLLTCVWRGSHFKRKAFNYLFLGFIACLQLPILHEWAKSSYECLSMPPNRLWFSYNVQECIRTCYKSNTNFRIGGFVAKNLNSSKLLSPIPNIPTNCKNWLWTVRFS